MIRPDTDSKQGERELPPTALETSLTSISDFSRLPHVIFQILSRR